MEGINTGIIEQEVSPVIRRVDTITIRDDESFIDAGALLVSIKALRKKVKEQFGPSTKKAHESWKAAKAVEQSFDDPLKDAESKMKVHIGTYQQMLEEKVAAEKARIEEETRKEIEDQRIANAAELEAKGETAIAEALIAAPIMVPEAKVEVAKPKGISTRTNYKAEVIDLKLLIDAVAKGAAPQACLKPDMSALNNMAKTYRDQMEIPGVKILRETVVSSRSTM